MPPLFDRVCAICGHVHTGTRAALTRLSRCEKCGEDLSSGLKVHAGRPGSAAAGGDAPSAAPADAPAPAAPAAPSACVLTCPSCGHRHEGTLEELRAQRYCEACGDFLSGASPVAAGGEDARPAAAGAPDAAAGALVLRLADAGVVEELPRAEGEGVFGRLTAAHPTLVSLRTLSRRQFAYRLRDDGSVEIRNLSRFGTTVQGQRLAEAGDAVTVTPPAVVEAAGLTFVLERTGA